MEDFIQLDGRYSAEEKLLRENTKRLIDELAVPILSEAYETATFPQELIPKFAEAGLLGMLVPKEYGGTPVSPVAYGLACQALEYGDSALRSFVSVQGALAMHAILQFGSETQKKQYLPAMARGEVIGSFALTEPDFGSDPADIHTTAKKVKGGWCLNGEKMWITNCNMANVSVMWAKTDEGIRGFLVPADAKGYTPHRLHYKLSMRISNTGGITLEDCVIPDDHMLPGTEIGLRSALSCLNEARFGVAWGVMGAAKACFDIALGYAKDRVQFKHPIAHFQLIQKDLVEMFTEITKADSLNLHVSQLKEKEDASVEMIAMMKMNACREALNVARLARNMMGAKGIILDSKVMRHMNNLEAVYTYEGTDNIHHLILGKYITGHNAFS